MIKSKNIIDKIDNRATLLILFVFSAMFFTQCKRTLKNEELTGPQLKPASSGFYVINGLSLDTIYKLTNSKTLYPGKPQFSYPAQSVAFNAKFAQSVSWTITLKGMISNATATITGTSDSISKANSTWDGSPSSVNFFIDKEFVIATLSFLGSSISYSDTIYLANAFKFQTSFSNDTINGTVYTVIDDFEALPSHFPISQVSPDLNDGGTVYGVADLDHHVFGQRSFRFYGTDISYNGYLLSMTNLDLNGMMQFDASVLKTKDSLTYLHNKFIGVTDPTLLYFNIYIYGTGWPNTDVMLQIYENDHMSNPRVMSANDSYIFHVPVNWTGWKLVSVKYSDFRRVGDPLTGGGGNGIKEPNLISSVGIVLNSYPTPGLYVDASIDYAVLTQYGPFVP